MNINKLTLGQIKEIQALGLEANAQSGGLNDMIGKKVIIRTYSAGVHYGTLAQKNRKEVILTNSRRMYQWWCKKSISLSAVSLYGLKEEKSKICTVVESIWLEAIEILPCTEEAIKSIESCEDVKAN